MMPTCFGRAFESRVYVTDFTSFETNIELFVFGLIRAWLPTRTLFVCLFRKAVLEPCHRIPNRPHPLFTSPHPPKMASLALHAMDLVARKTRIELLADCTIDTCPIDSSYYFYRVSLAANATFIALFSLSLLGFLLTFAFTRRATAFHVAILSGVILEVIGYAGRIMSWKNQWQEQGFLMQIVCLTIAPAFIAGGIYLCLRRIVYAFGPENSRIRPETYTRFVRAPLSQNFLRDKRGD